MTSSVQYSEMLGEVIASRMAYLMAPVAEKPMHRDVFEDIMYEAMEQDREASANPRQNKTWSDTT